MITKIKATLDYYTLICQPYAWISSHWKGTYIKILPNTEMGAHKKFIIKRTNLESLVLIFIYTIKKKKCENCFPDRITHFQDPVAVCDVVGI